MEVHRITPLAPSSASSSLLAAWVLLKACAHGRRFARTVRKMFPRFDFTSLMFHLLQGNTQSLTRWLVFFFLLFLNGWKDSTVSSASWSWPRLRWCILHHLRFRNNLCHRCGPRPAVSKEVKGFLRVCLGVEGNVTTEKNKILSADPFMLALTTEASGKYKVKLQLGPIQICWKKLSNRIVFESHQTLAIRQFAGPTQRLAQVCAVQQGLASLSMDLVKGDCEMMLSWGSDLGFWRAGVATHDGHSRINLLKWKENPWAKQKLWVVNGRMTNDKWQAGSLDNRLKKNLARKGWLEACARFLFRKMWGAPGWRHLRILTFCVLDSFKNKYTPW